MPEVKSCPATKKRRGRPKKAASTSSPPKDANQMNKVIILLESIDASLKELTDCVIENPRKHGDKKALSIKEWREWK